MEAISNFNQTSLLNIVVSLVTAFVLSGVIGFERQVRQRTAGLRTNTLVAVSAAVFVAMANRLNGHEGAVHVAAYVVSGIGFLGAGAIMKQGANITGLNTAATLWGSAAVGPCAGASLIGEAFVAALFVLAGARRDGNFAYTLLKAVTSPIMKATRFVAPRFVVDAHIGFLALFFLLVIEAILILLKIRLYYAALAG